MMSRSTELEWVEFSRRGDQEAFGRIVERYQTFVCSIAYSAIGDRGSSEDVAQETFVAAWQQLSQLRDATKLRSWLGGIARNLARNHFRSQANKVRATGGEIEQGLVDYQQGLPETRVIECEEQAMLWDILSDIPENYREPLVLYYREDQSVRKVAELMELSEDAVKQRLSRGRKLIRKTVAAFVETSLSSSKPSKAFATGVLALLPTASAQATGVGLVASGAKGTAVAVKSAAVSSGMIGAILGPLIGVAGAVFGARASLKHARSADERRFLWRTMGLVSLLVALLVVSHLVVRLVAPSVFATLWYQIPAWSLYVVILLTFISWGNRRQGQIRAQDGTAADAQRHFDSQPVSPAAFRGSLAGSMFGSTCWVWITAMVAQDWTSAVAAIVATAVAWWAIAFPLFRAGSVRNQLSLYRWSLVTVGVITVSAIILRWNSWRETPPLQSVAWVSPWLLSLLLVGGFSGLWVLLYSRERRLLREDGTTHRAA